MTLKQRATEIRKLQGFLWWLVQEEMQISQLENAQAAIDLIRDKIMEHKSYVHLDACENSGHWDSGPCSCNSWERIK